MSATMNGLGLIPVSSCVVLALLASGCGGSGEHFKRDYAAEQPELTRLGTDIGNALQGARGRSDAQLESQFTDLAQRTGEALKKLQAIKAPRKDAVLFDTVEGGLRKVQQDLGAVAAAARADSAGAAQSATTALIADATAVKGAGDQLKHDLGIATK
jgi:hypothetical protein